jgi:hypothetical protein
MVMMACLGLWLDMKPVIADASMERETCLVERLLNHS